MSPGARGALPIREGTTMAVEQKVWTEEFVELSHGKTRYWEAGTGYPTILLHGAGWTSGCETWPLSV